MHSHPYVCVNMHFKLFAQSCFLLTTDHAPIMQHSCPWQVAHLAEVTKPFHAYYCILLSSYREQERLLSDLGLC
uniref:LMBR1 domain-containing protein 2 homolog A-like n=1 Tax=Rhizophora mucronata TaxID=61149 RepID=A0A2P2M4N5_RHIMU